MKALLAVLVVALAATSAWLWHALEQERGRKETSYAAPSRSPVGALRENDPLAAGRLTPRQPPGDDEHADFDQARFNRGLVFSGRDPRLLQDQGYMDARRRYLEAAFAQRYPDLARVLEVPEQTALRVVELSHEAQMRESGVTVNTADAPDFWLEEQQKAYESDAAIAALIGEGKLKRWKEYESSIWERHQVRALRLELVDSADPLAGDTAEALIHALYVEQQTLAQETEAASGSMGAVPGAPTVSLSGNAAGLEIEQERRALKAAEKKLTPYQFQIFRTMIERQRTAQRAMEEMDRLGMEALK